MGHFSDFLAIFQYNFELKVTNFYYPVAGKMSIKSVNTEHFEKKKPHVPRITQPKN